MIRKLIINFLKEFCSVLEKEPQKKPQPEVVKPDPVQESKGTQIGQFMTTHAMRKDLRDLGYNKFQIDALSPDEAAKRIKEQKGPNG